MTPRTAIPVWISIMAGLVLSFLGSLPAWSATISWNNASGGNWSVAGNWAGGVLPGPTDDAVITLAGSYTVTLDTSPTVASLTLGGVSGTQTLTANNRSLTLGGPSVVGSHGAMSFDTCTLAGMGSLTSSGNSIYTGCTINIPVTCATGTITLRSTTVNAAYTSQSTTRIVSQTVTFNGTLSLQSGSLVTIEGANSFDVGILSVSSSFTNQGTIELRNPPSSTSGCILRVTGGTLVNAPGAVIRGQASKGNSIEAQIDNQGVGSSRVDLQACKLEYSIVSPK